MNCDKMAGGRLTVCEQELLYAFVHLVSISSNFLSNLPMEFFSGYHAIGDDIDDHVIPEDSIL